MVKFMKKQFLYKIFFAAVILAFAACNDPIYYNISLEEKMLEPLIKGSPTNFVEFKNNMYVASGDTLYKYNGTNSSTGRGMWTEITPGGGKIIALAATTNNLYALCLGSVLRTSTTGNNNTWSDVSVHGNPRINTIYAADTQLFIGAGGPNRNSYYIVHGNSNNIIVGLGNNLLNGAAFHSGNYYLSAKDQYYLNGGAIYTTTNPSSGTAATVDTGSFVGIINTNLGSNPVKAINRSGTVYNVTSGSVSPTDTSMDNRLATGGLAVWENGSNQLLLAGRQDRLRTTVSSGYSHGYMEVGITGGNITGNFTEPGISSPSTIIDLNNGRYRSTIGIFPVNHLFQASDGILFASTQRKGVFSYRNRKDGWGWNAED